MTAQFRLNDTRVHARGEDSVLRKKTPRRADSAKHICRLATVVAVERDVRGTLHVFVPPCLEERHQGLLLGGKVPVRRLKGHVTPTQAAVQGRRGAEVDDPGRAAEVDLCGGDELRHEQAGQQPVADVIGGEVQLHAVGCDGALADAHDARAVDDEINGGHVVPREDGSGGDAHGLLFGEVHLEEAVVGVEGGASEGVDALLDLGRAAAREDEPGRALSDEGLCGGEGEAADVGAGDEDGLAADGAGEGSGDLGAGGVGSELGVGDECHAEPKKACVWWV